MKRLKRTYALPSETFSRFERVLAPGQRSAKIAELMEAWVSAGEREALRRDIEEGCREMADIYRETAKEWEPLDAEVDYVFDR